ncbi:MAG: hypothetical protein IJL48_06790 [Bacteroidales bacterium]|nr:hypothetical protein [Bacteroidales bacterium]
MRPRLNALSTPPLPCLCSLPAHSLPHRSAGKFQRTARHEPLGSFNPGSMLCAFRLVIRYHIG